MQNDSTLLFVRPRMFTENSGASCDVSLCFPWDSGSLYRAWHQQDTVGSGSFLWNLASPMTACSEVWTRKCTDVSQVQVTGTDFLTCLIFRVQNPSETTVDLWWAWGLSLPPPPKKKSITHLPAKHAKTIFFLSLYHRHAPDNITQGARDWDWGLASHFWLAGWIFNPAVWGSGRGWHGRTIALRRFTLLSNR